MLSAAGVPRAVLARSLLWQIGFQLPGWVRRQFLAVRPGGLAAGQGVSLVLG